jgi:poly(3-hydroxyalkanoate) synthetase
MNVEKNNIITDWLSQYGDPEIEKRVEREAEHINRVEDLKKGIKNYCEIHKLKFEKYIQGGFLASCLIPIKARMGVDIHSGKFIFSPIREIGKKRICRKFIAYLDGDIVDGGFHDFPNP